MTTNDMRTIISEYRGSRGRAWRGDREGLRAKLLSAGAWLPVWDRGIDTWIVRVPDVYPHLAWFVASACSLAPVPGVEPARRQGGREDATHELIVVALDPDFAPPGEMSPPEGWHDTQERRWGTRWLSPPELIAQVKLPEDDACRELLELLVRAFCNGEMLPDCGWRERNERMLDGAAARLRGESRG